MGFRGQGAPKRLNSANCGDEGAVTERRIKVVKGLRRDLQLTTVEGLKREKWDALKLLDLVKPAVELMECIGIGRVATDRSRPEKTEDVVSFRICGLGLEEESGE